MAHTTCGSEKTDGGKHPRARSGRGLGQGQSLWIDLCVPSAPPRPCALVLPPSSLPLPSVPGIPHPQLVPLGAGVGRRVRRVLAGCIASAGHLIGPLGGLLGDMLEVGWWRAGVNP